MATAQLAPPPTTYCGSSKERSSNTLVSLLTCCVPVSGVVGRGGEGRGRGQRERKGRGGDREKGRGEGRGQGEGGRSE